jgi:hypothetical protein
MFVTLMLPIFEISRASFLISCFSLKITCEIKKISWQHAAMLADFLMPCKRIYLLLGYRYKIFQEIFSNNDLSNKTATREMINDSSYFKT